MRTPQQQRAIPQKARAILQECKRLICECLPDTTVLLYGSVARGTAGPEADYDILVLTEHPLSPADEDRANDALYELELKHGVVLSTLFFAKSQWDDPLHRAMPLHREIEREGIIL